MGGSKLPELGEVAREVVTSGARKRFRGETCRVWLVVPRAWRACEPFSAATIGEACKNPAIARKLAKRSRPSDRYDVIMVLLNSVCDRMRCLKTRL